MDRLCLDPLTGQIATDGLIKLAGQLAWTRPIGPYPGWKCDVDWYNPAAPYQLRKTIWNHFHDHKLRDSITMDWYGGLRFNLFLGNDLSRQLYVGGCLEPNEFAFVGRFLRPGMTFVDVGANEGLYTLFGSRLVGPEGTVWAFEPSRREFGRLRQNLQLNDLANVRAFRLALSREPAEVELAVAADEHAGQNTLGQFTYPIEMLHKETVTTVRLDDMVAAEGLERLDLIKIDVEGAESAVLEGASQMLRQFRPTLLIEIVETALQYQGRTSEDLLRFLRSFGYFMYCFDEATGRPVPAKAGEFSDNIIAAPSENRLNDLLHGNVN